VQFIDPDFWIDGYKVINIVDLKALLGEWMAFLEQFEASKETEQPQPGFFQKLMNKFRSL